jgi:hypothetical protein
MPGTGADPPARGSPSIANGLPNVTIVGLTDRAIQEARERVRASIRNAGFEFPQRRLTVNLAPAEVPKEGTRIRPLDSNAGAPALSLQPMRYPKGAASRH